MKRSPAQRFARVIGLTLVAAGAIGFAYSSSFGSPGHTDSVLGILDVNGWHNLVHLATGAVGLAVAGSYERSRRYAVAVALLYAAIAIWGFVIGDGESILQLVPVNTEDSVLHALIAVAACAAGFSTPATPPPTPAGGEPGPGFRFD